MDLRFHLEFGYKIKMDKSKKLCFNVLLNDAYAPKMELSAFSVSGGLIAAASRRAKHISDPPRDQLSGRPRSTANRSLIELYSASFF